MTATKQEIIDRILMEPLDKMLSYPLPLEDALVLLEASPRGMAHLRKHHSRPRWVNIDGQVHYRMSELVWYLKMLAPDLMELLVLLMAIEQLPGPKSPKPPRVVRPAPTQASRPAKAQMPPEVPAKLPRGRKPGPPKKITKPAPRIITRTPPKPIARITPRHIPEVAARAANPTATLAAPATPVVPLEAAPFTLLDTKQAAALLGVKVRTLHDWRQDRIGPPYTKVGHLVRYQLSDLQAWVDSRKVKPR